MEKSEKITLTKKELATIAGYSYRRLHDIDMGMPENGKLFIKSEGGKYDLALFVQRWVQYKVDAESVGEQTLDDVKAKHEIVKTRKTELEVERLEGKLVDVQEIRKLWGDVAKTVTQNLLRMPSVLAPRMTMIKNADVIADMMDREIRDILCQIADTPLPEYAEEGEADEGESEEE